LSLASLGTGPRVVFAHRFEPTTPTGNRVKMFLLANETFCLWSVTTVSWK
jgi:hypothetical protein